MADRRFPIAAALAGVLAAGLVSLPASGTAGPSKGPDSDMLLTEEQKAFDRAEESDRPVEVESARSETQSLYALPDGTYRRDITALPSRVQTADGWAPIDLTLVDKGDGTVGPRAAAGDIRFSNGGSSLVLRSTFETVTTTMSWPEHLPTPVLDGATAIYPNVFDGVDLRMTAKQTGTSQVLVVKNAEAAANPELKRLDLATEVDGGELVRVGDRLELRDDLGVKVAEAAAPMMWDSSGRAISDDKEPVPPATPEAIDLRTTGPVEGDEVAAVGVTLTNDVVTLLPDADALVGDDVEYPVYVDPVLDADRNLWAMVFKQHPTMEFYKWTGSEGVGYQDGTYGGGVSTKRLFWRFDTSDLNDPRVRVSWATFSAKMVHSWSCTATTTHLYRTAAVNSTTNWNNQPDFESQYHQDSISAAAGRDGCNPDGKLFEWDATAGARQVAGNYDSITLALKAASETSTSSWKRFTNTATLSVGYARAPDAPSSMTVNGLACGSTPKLGNMPVGPKVVARLTDADHGNMFWQYHYMATPRNPSTGVWPAWTVPTGDPKHGPVAHGASVSTPAIPITKVGGKFPSGRYAVRIRAIDDNSLGLAGAWTACYFDIDSDAPGTPGAVFDSATEVPTAGAPIAVRFTPPPPAAGENEADFVGYRWSTTSTMPSSGTVAKTNPLASITPKAGLNRIWVWAVDEAQNVTTAPYIFTFEAEGFTSTTSSRYPFDEGSGSQIATSNSSPGKALTVQQPLWTQLADVVDTTPFTDYLLDFDGDATRVASSTTPPLDLTNSFTITGWVKPSIANAQNGDRRVAISLGDETSELLKIGVESNASGTPSYKYFLEGKTPNGTPVKITSDLGPSSIDTRKTFVAAQYSAATQEIRLYVRTDTGASAWSAPAALDLRNAGSSRGLSVGGRAPTLWLGKIDEVELGTGLLGEPGRQTLWSRVANRGWDGSEFGVVPW